MDEIDVRELTILSEGTDDNTTSTEFTLTSFTNITGPSLLPLGPGHPPEITIEFSADDLNTIKRLRLLAISNETTYISITDMFAEDAFGNEIDPIFANMSLLVTEFTPDTTKPTLVSVTFSADTGLLSLTFDETVQSSSFNVTTVMFLNEITGTEYTLKYSPPSRNAYISENDSTVIDITLANADLNEIKILEDLAVDNVTTSISLTNWTVLDMNNNCLNVSNLPMQVDEYFEDETRPQLEAFDLDMDGAPVLTLYFSETVNVSTLNIDQITLHPAEDSSDHVEQSYTLQPGPEYPLGTFTNSTNGPIVLLYIGTLDSNEIKRRTSLATLKNNTYIGITNDTVRDMVGLDVVPINNSTTHMVSGYTEDATNPTLLSFDFDLNSGSLILTFDETVDASSLQETAITLQNHQSDPSQSYAVMNGEILNLLNDPVNDPVVTFRLDFYDLNQVKLMRDLATMTANTYINLASGAILDLADVQRPSNPTIQLAQNHTDDDTNPILLEYVINVNTSVLILNFDEPVDHLTLDTKQITFQAASNRSSDPLEYYTLRSSTSTSPSGLEIIVDINVNDLNEIKYREGLLISDDTAYLSFTADLISDMRSNPVTAIPSLSGMPPLMYVNDTGRPNLVEFHLDMDASILHLTFHETMNAASANFTSFSLQADSFVNNSLHTYRLTGGIVNPLNDSTVISIVLMLDDVNAIKILQIAMSTQTSWLLIDEYGIEDQNGLQIIPLLNGANAQRASQYTIDRTRPQLLIFDLDLNE